MSELSFVASDTSPSIFGVLAISGTPVNLTGVTGVKFQMRMVGSFRYVVDNDATVITPTDGTVRYDLSPGDLAIPGDYLSRWQVTFGDGTVQHSEPENTITIDPA